MLWLTLAIIGLIMIVLPLIKGLETLSWLRVVGGILCFIAVCLLIYTVATTHHALVVR